MKTIYFQPYFQLQNWRLSTFEASYFKANGINFEFSKKKVTYRWLFWRCKKNPELKPPFNFYTYFFIRNFQTWVEMLCQILWFLKFNFHSTTLHCDRLQCKKVANNGLIMMISTATLIFSPLIFSNYIFTKYGYSFILIQYSREGNFGVLKQLCLSHCLGKFYYVQ